MKNFKIKSLLFSLLAVLMITFTMTSCDKNEAVIDPADAVEGNKSTTNNTEEIEDIDLSQAEEPVLQKSFSGDMTKEEADAEWDKAVADFIETYKVENGIIEDRGVSTDWFVSIRTRTGSQLYNGTDATVVARFGFRSSYGYTTHGWVNLNNSGDDREEGNWDYYLFRHYISGQAVSWVEARWGQLALKGTDGWFVTDFDAHIYPSLQTVNASGISHIHSDPNVWLDNSTSTAWDYYSTGTVGYGRTNF